MFTFTIVEQGDVGRTECAICLLMFDLSPVMVKARGDRGDDVYLMGYVCRWCLRDGADRIVRELRNRAESSRRQARELDRWADEPIELPSEVESLLRSDDPLWTLTGKASSTDKIQ